MSKAELKDFTFKSRHIGPTKEDEAFMLRNLGYENSEEFISSVIPVSYTHLTLPTIYSV